MILSHGLLTNCKLNMLLPKISVVIPCFNYAHYVGQAIDSVLVQEYPRLDLVVVNDGSTDDSLSEIRRHAPNATIIDQPNQGHVASCNAGFAASTGELVIFLDADDLLAPTALQEVASVWSPSLVKVQYDLAIIDVHGNELGRRFGHFRPGYTPQRVRDDFARTGTYRWPVLTGNAYSRWYLSVLLPLSVPRAPDGYLNTLAPLYGDVLTLPQALGRYRLHNANLSSAARSGDGLGNRIGQRRAELAELRRHAAMRAVILPNVDPLDHELPFLNYRLMAAKSGKHYPGCDRDRPFDLLLKALRQLWYDRLPVRAATTHALWFIVMAVMPKRFVSAMIKLRFERAQLKRAWKQRLLHLEA